MEDKPKVLVIQDENGEKLVLLPQVIFMGFRRF